MSQEVTPFFPSATHPGIPVATQILSTLRALTVPGKGNDLRAEERTALVGVAALLGCERVQSHDLVETSAQRASSVSPARFRSALATSRRLLAEKDTGRSRTSPRRQSSSTSNSAGTSSTSNSGSTSTSPAISPFSTPKKKFKFSSGVDVSGLVTPRHAPVVASPLRQSVTPSKRKRAVEAIEEGEEEERGGDKTPTKATPAANVHARLVEVKKAKERDGAAAFLALRPGTRATAAVVDVEVEIEPGPREKAKYDPLLALGLETPRRVRKIRVRADWTFRETVWSARPFDWTKIGKGNKSASGSDREAETLDSIILTA